jgi:flagellar biosynthesis GTPase FlhF
LPTSSETTKRESETTKRESETTKRESETTKRESETKKRESETKKRESETKNRDSETKNRDSETKKRDSETKNRENATPTLKEFFLGLENDEFVLESSQLGLKIGLGDVDKWILNSDKVNCTKFSSSESCQGSLERGSNTLNIVYLIDNQKITRISLTSFDPKTKPLVAMIEEFQNLGTFGENRYYSGVEFKVILMKKFKAIYLFSFNMAMIMIEPL